ncbi:MAG: aldehyde dehydrogenase family protein [Candidatus Nitrosopolaris sp.]
MKENGAVEDKRVAELKTINPATEEVINRYEIITKEQINEKVKKARDAFDEWKKDSKKRTDIVHDLAQRLRKDKEELAKTATKEMGKAIKEVRLGSMTSLFTNTM